ncbi:hypothetical protein BGX26_005141 [Mortierella sp. AD094]|nr:hypothetical protein BGX26_005141 [Mortierella sp. AD094]
MKVTIFAIIVAVATASAAEAVSCQAQGNNNGHCISGDRDCPGGQKSVFWDTGCHSKDWWDPWDKDDKCCIPN